MKVLVSAMACDPCGGSEGGVGWAAVNRIALKHDVRVLVHAHSKSSWDSARSRGLVRENVRVRFLGLDEKWNSNRLIARAQSWQRFLAFNREVLGAAMSWHEEEPCDVVHQVTYATWRVPSPLWRMPVPFVWGPIGGVATIPKPFMGMLSLEARIMEFVRAAQTRFTKNSSAFLECVSNSSVVLAANEETEVFLRKYRGEKPMYRLPVAYLPPEKVVRFSRTANTSSSISGPLRLFAGGNIEGRKGVSLALQALALVKRAGVEFVYTVAGGGPEIAKLQALSKSLGIENEVIFHRGFRGDAYVEALHQSDIYFLPSFRETTPVTLQEAVLAGCYPIVADASAAGEMVRLVGGKAVAADEPNVMIAGLCAAILEAAGDRESMRQSALEAARNVATKYSELNYDQVTEVAYSAALS